MSALSQLGAAFLMVCQPQSLLFMVAGVAIGIVFGSIPGLSASMAVALMLPLTFSMEATLGMNVLVAVYIGGISGGLISAILLNMQRHDTGSASSLTNFSFTIMGAVGMSLITSIWTDYILGISMLAMITGVIGALFCLALRAKLGSGSLG